MREDSLVFREVGRASPPSERDGFVRIVADIPRSKDDPTWPPLDREGLWAWPLGGNRYRIANIPFYVRELNLGDIVCARPDSQSSDLIYDRVAEDGGHSTYRVIVAQELNEQQHLAFHALLQTIMGWGCSTERAGPIFFAIDIPPMASAHAVFDVLRIGRDEGIWSFEGASFSGSTHGTNRDSSPHEADNGAGRIEVMKTQRFAAKRLAARSRWK